MISYTVWSEAGGVGKTTMTATLADAHARAGQKVLAIDMDPQDGGLTHRFGATDRKADPEADNLPLHLIGRPRGEFEELVVPVRENLDLVPAHDSLENLTEWLLKTATIEEDTHPDDSYTFPREEQLRRVLVDAGVHTEYDVLIIDPPATPGQHVYNAVFATSNLLIPLELSAKGDQSVEGLKGIVANIEERMANVEVGVLAVVPNKCKNTTVQNEYRERLVDQEFAVPIVVGERGAMFEGAWDEQMSVFEFVESRSRVRDRERETLAKFEELAAFITAQFETPEEASA